MLLAIAASRLAASTVGDQDAFAMSHIMSPVTDVSLLSIAVKMLTLPVPLVMSPIADVVLFVVIIALPMATISQVCFPIAGELIARLFLLIRADISAPAISLIQIVNMSFIYISVCIVDLYDLLLRLVRLCR